MLSPAQAWLSVPPPWPSWQHHTEPSESSWRDSLLQDTEPLYWSDCKGERGPCVNICLSQPQASWREDTYWAGQSSWSRSLKDEDFLKDLPTTARHPEVQTRGRLLGQGSTWWERLMWSYTPQPLHPTPSWPPCHSENRILGRALASESGSLGTGILAPKLDS